MSFLEVQFPTNISLGSKGGPKWRTVVTQVSNGWEQRIQKWEDIKASYDVGYGIREITDLKAVVGFFNQARGRAYGFRFKDWLDYSITNEVMELDGSPTFQLQKVYGSGSNNYTRDIRKPVAGVTVLRNAGSFTNFTLDTTTGIGTFTTHIFSGSVSGVTPGATTVVTFSAAHSRGIGDKIYFSELGGMSEINELVGTVLSLPSSTQVEVDIDSSTFTTWTSGGTGKVYVESGDIFSWTGEFDVPVRFADDSLSVTLDTHDLGGTAIMLEEIRV